MAGGMKSWCSGFLMSVFFRRSEIGLRCVRTSLRENNEGNECSEIVSKLRK
jgi:hypothetical protein